MAEQQKHSTVDRASVSDFVGASPTACTNEFQGCRLTGKPTVSRIEILSSNLSVPAKHVRTICGSGWLLFIPNDFGFQRATGRCRRRFYQFIRKGSLTGKAVVSKTTAHFSLAGSSPVPSAKHVRQTLKFVVSQNPSSSSVSDKLRLVDYQEASPNGMAAVCYAAAHCVCRFKSCRLRQSFGGEFERQHWWLSAQLAHHPEEFTDL